MKKNTWKKLNDDQKNGYLLAMREIKDHMEFAGLYGNRDVNPKTKLACAHPKVAMNRIKKLVDATLEGE